MTWEVEAIDTYVIRRYVCFQFPGTPGDEAMLLIRKSTFMYGWLNLVGGNSKACWHAVASTENRELAERIVKL